MKNFEGNSNQEFFFLKCALYYCTTVTNSIIRIHLSAVSSDLLNESFQFIVCTVTCNKVNKLDWRIQISSDMRRVAHDDKRSTWLS